MSSSKNTFQYKESMSINRHGFLNKVVRNNDLNKKELRVCNHLLTHLDGVNFKEISKKQIAYDLNISKSDVTDAIYTLIDHEIIEEGSSASVKHGLRFLF